MLRALGREIALHELNLSNPPLTEARKRSFPYFRPNLPCGSRGYVPDPPDRQVRVKFALILPLRQSRAHLALQCFQLRQIACHSHPDDSRPASAGKAAKPLRSNDQGRGTQANRFQSRFQVDQMCCCYIT